MKKHHKISIAVTLTLILISAQLAFADTIYTVASGDSLGKIAEYFGVGQSEIIARNAIANPDWIYVGQELLIPDGSGVDEVEQVEPLPEAEPEPAPEVEPAPESEPEPVAELPSETTETVSETVQEPADEGVAEVAPDSAETAPNPATYTVQPGDTLSRIAIRFGLDMWSLASVNGLTNPELIYVGQELLLSAEGLPQLTAPAWAPMPSTAIEGEKWIDVNLTTQTLVAYEGNTPVYQSLISSGLPQYATITGEFRIWLRHESQTMNGLALGYDYYTENVPYVMYFSGNFAIHGAFWHNNFGQPMSHGCVNTPVDVAAWLFNWSSNGTLVNVHY